MNVFYEDSGELRAAKIFTQSEQNLMVEAQTGKRSKIKKQAVLFEFAESNPDQFLTQAKNIQNQLDVDLLWQVCPQSDSLDVNLLAEEYLGKTPTHVELAGFYLAIFNAPIYFYKRGKGLFKRAPEENVKAALVGIEKKKIQEEQKLQSLNEVLEGKIPSWLTSHYQSILYQPDKNTWEYKTADFIAKELAMTLPQMMVHCGIIKNSHDFFLEKFVFDYISPEPDPIIFDMNGLLVDLEAANVEAFSIDDATTTEIDDAFSISELDDQFWLIGIHIAAPGLGIKVESELALHAQKRLSTVYMPGQKIPMLPESFMSEFSLNANCWRPVVSCYLQVSKNTFEIVNKNSKIEKIWIQDNLRLHELQPLFLDNDEIQPHQYRKSLTILLRLARHLADLRGVNNRPQPNYIDFDFFLNNDQIQITQRPRGSALDTLVAELMIEVNQTWADVIASSNLKGLYRVQENGKTYMSLVPKPHQGLGVTKYAWTSSPLRRYIDLVNQWQLIQILKQRVSNCFSDVNRYDEIAKSFDIIYGIYLDFQRNMEKYWSLRWLQQENISLWQGVALRDNVLRLKDLPLVITVTLETKLVPGQNYQIKINNIDLWELNCNCELIQ